MSVSSYCCVVSGRGLCDRPITRPPYRLWCVTVCDPDTSRMRRPWPALGCCVRKIVYSEANPGKNRLVTQTALTTLPSHTPSRAADHRYRQIPATHVSKRNMKHQGDCLTLGSAFLFAGLPPETCTHPGCPAIIGFRGCRRPLSKCRSGNQIPRCAEC